MSKSLKSIEEQKQDIVKYTSMFKDVEHVYYIGHDYYIVFCPDGVVMEVLINLLKNQGYAEIVVEPGSYSFRINLLEPTITVGALVAMMRQHLQLLDDNKLHEDCATQRRYARTELRKFLESIGIDGEVLYK